MEALVRTMRTSVRTRTSGTTMIPRVRVMTIIAVRVPRGAAWLGMLPRGVLWVIVLGCRAVIRVSPCRRVLVATLVMPGGARTLGMPYRGILVIITT